MARTKEEAQATRKSSPANLLSKDHKMQMAERTEERKNEATSPEHVLKPYHGYDTHKNVWAVADDAQRKALVYGLVLFDGFVKMTDIARLFQVKASEVEKYGDLFHSAKMALKGKIQRNMLSLGLQREDLLALKFHLGLQYAEHTMNPVHDGVADTGENNKIQIEIITKDKPGDAAGETSTEGLGHIGKFVTVVPKHTN
jgi:hypothetical protein